MWNGCCARWAVLSISKTADLLGFSRKTIYRVYIEWTEKRKYPVSGSCVDEKCLVDVRGEWADWLEMIERQQ